MTCGRRRGAFAGGQSRSGPQALFAGTSHPPSPVKWFCGCPHFTDEEIESLSDLSAGLGPMGLPAWVCPHLTPGTLQAGRLPQRGAGPHGHKRKGSAFSSLLSVSLEVRTFSPVARSDGLARKGPPRPLLASLGAPPPPLSSKPDQGQGSRRACVTGAEVAQALAPRQVWGR